MPEVEIVVNPPMGVPQNPEDHSGTEDPTVPNDGGVNTVASATVLPTSVMPDNAHEEETPKDPGRDFGVDKEEPFDLSEIEATPIEKDELPDDESERSEDEHPYSDIVPPSMFDVLSSHLGDPIEVSKLTADDFEEDEVAKLEAEFDKAVAEENQKNFLTPAQFMGHLRELGGYDERFSPREMLFLSELLKEEVIYALHGREEAPPTWSPTALLIGLDSVIIRLKQAEHSMLVNKLVSSRDSYLSHEEPEMKPISAEVAEEHITAEYLETVKESIEGLVNAFNRVQKIANRVVPSGESND